MEMACNGMRLGPRSKRYSNRYKDKVLAVDDAEDGDGEEDALSSVAVRPLPAGAMLLSNNHVAPSVGVFMVWAKSKSGRTMDRMTETLVSPLLTPRSFNRPGGPNAIISCGTKKRRERRMKPQTYINEQTTEVIRREGVFKKGWRRVNERAVISDLYRRSF